MKAFRSLIVAALALSSSVALAQPATSAPASQPAPHKLVMPPGFKLVSVNGRSALVDPADEGWVTTALGKIPANPKAATQPASYLEKLKANRENIIRQMMADLSTNDPVPLAKGYDTDLVPAIRTLDGLKPPLFFFVTTPEKLAAAMKAGWQDPRFTYNRAADSVSFSLANALATDRPMDDIVIPTIFDPKEAVEKHGDSITLQITGVEAQLGHEVDMRARMLVGANLAKTINDSTFENMTPKPKEDEVWFGVGVASILAAKYTAIITGEQRDQLVGQLIFEHPQNPLKMSAIDLLHPIDLKSMRPELVGVYLDVIRRKSCRAIQYLVQEGGGDTAISKSTQAFREKKPADGAALVKLIQEVTKVDLTPALVR